MANLEGMTPEERKKYKKKMVDDLRKMMEEKGYEEKNLVNPEEDKNPEEDCSNCGPDGCGSNQEQNNFPEGFDPSKITDQQKQNLLDSLKNIFGDKININDIGIVFKQPGMGMTGMPGMPGGPNMPGVPAGQQPMEDFQLPDDVDPETGKKKTKARMEMEKNNENGRDITDAKLMDLAIDINTCKSVDDFLKRI